ncbi:MAG: preprotein translocase subunit SecG [Pontixanthobacter sp.]
MFFFLTVLQTIVAAAMVVAILMQRSEGGGLGIGGSPNGMMSARGAADFLTRATKWLAVSFVVLSIVLAAIAVKEAGGGAITSTVERGVADPITGPTAPGGADGLPATLPADIPNDDPLADVTE